MKSHRPRPAAALYPVGERGRRGTISPRWAEQTTPNAGVSLRTEKRVAESDTSCEE